MTLPPQVAQPRALADQLLDRGFDAATGQPLSRIARNVSAGLIAQRLNELDEEAARLQEDGESLSASNAVLRALLADLSDVLKRNAALMDNTAPDIQAVSVNAAAAITRQMALAGISNNLLRQIGIRWNTPTPEAVTVATDYTRGSAWRESLDAYERDTTDRVRAVALSGMADGQQPDTIANSVRAAVVGLPVLNATTTLRTLELVTYRAASVVNRVSNADIVAYQIRIAVLDDVTCPSCWALHGTRLEIDEQVDDHPYGRCDSIPVIVGREIEITTGEDMFDRLHEDQQLAVLGQSGLRAYQDGAVTLRDFVHRETDPVFGQMLSANSLKGILGQGARDYYSR